MARRSFRISTTKSLMKQVSRRGTSASKIFHAFWAFFALVTVTRACIAFIGAIDGAPSPSKVAGQEPTDQQVTPILLRRCTVCHGARKCEGDLDLRTRAAMLKGGKSGPAITLGSPDESLLIRRVRLGEMPPLQRLVEVSVKPIEPAEIDQIGRASCREGA